MQKFLVVLIGIIFIGIGVFLYFKNDSLVKNCTVEAEATVVDMKEELSTDDDISYIYYPVIEYKVDGKTITAEMGNGSSNPKYRLNDKVTILYNPNKTKEFIVKGDKSSNLLSFIFAAVGLFVTWYGIKMIVSKDNNNVSEN